MLKAVQSKLPPVLSSTATNVYEVTDMAVGTNELAVVLGNLQGSIGGFIDPIKYISYMLGFILLGIGIMHLRRLNDGPQGNSGGRAVATIAVGVILLSIPGFADAMSYTLFGHKTEFLSAVPSGGGDPVGAYISFAVTVVVIVGFYCVVKGLVKLRATGDGREDQWWSGCTHIVGGIICCNIVSFMKIIGSAAGGTIQDVVNKLL